jgi:autotransporter translocation and assembly factor TamB
LDAELRTAQLALAKLPFVCGHADGQVNLEATARDLLSKAPRLAFDLKAKQLSLGSRDQLDVHLQGEANHEHVSAGLKLRGRERYKDAWAHLRAKVLWTLGDGKLVLLPNAALDARVEFNDFPVAPLLPPESPVSYASGTIDAKIDAQGQLISPLVHGTLDLNRLSFTTNALAQPLSNVSGHFDFNGRRAQLTKFEAHDQKGKLELSGEVDLSNMARVTSQLRIKADDFPLRQRGQVAATTTMKLAATGIITPNQSEVRLVFDEVDTWLETVALRLGIPLKAHDEFIIDGRTPAQTKKARKQALAAAAQAQADSPPDTEPKVLIFIDAQQRFWIKRKDFAVKLKAELEARVEDSAVRVLGDVMIDRGYLQLFGKVFDLRRESSVRFTGSNPPNPALQLDADYKTRSGKIVAVSISGRASAPVLTFFIDGNQVDAGIAVQELFGGEKGSGTSDATSQAQNFVSGLTAGILATAARRELGAAAPIIMIDPSEKSGEGRVRAGFELDTLVPPFLRPIVTGAYLEGVAARESQGNSNPSTQFGALLELYFPKNFFTAGQYGPGTTWSLDFGWQL